MTDTPLLDKFSRADLTPTRPAALKAYDLVCAERDRLRTDKAELVAALKDLFRETNQHATGDCKGLLLACKNASAIIAKAKGETP